MGGGKDCDAVLGDCRRISFDWSLSRCGVRHRVAGRSTASEDALLTHRTLSTARSGAPSSLHSIPANAMLML